MSCLPHVDLYASNGQRNPYFKGGARGVVVNNLIDNPGSAAIHYGLQLGEWGMHPWVSGQIAIVGTVLNHGSDTKAGLALFSTNGTPCELFLEDNLAFDRARNSVRLTSGAYTAKDSPPTWPPGLQSIPASEVKEYILANAGARPWDRDDVDRRIVQQVRDGKGKIARDLQNRRLSLTPASLPGRKTKIPPGLVNDRPRCPVLCLAADTAAKKQLRGFVVERTSVRSSSGINFALRACLSMADYALHTSWRDHYEHRAHSQPGRSSRMKSTPRRKRLAGIGISLIAAIAVVWSLLLLLGHHSQSIGLIENDSQAFPGYTLLAPIFSTTTYLIDMDGRVVNTWESEYEPGQVAYLLEDGHLLRAGSLARKNAAFSAGGGTGGRVQEFAWDGELVWDFEYSSDSYLLHHDVKRLPNGNILMIAWERKTAPQAIAAGRNPELQGKGELWPDFIIEVRPTGPTTGKIVWQWRVWDHLIQDHDSSQADYGDVALHPERIDVNHCFGWTDRLTNKEVDKLKSLGYLGSSTAPKPKHANPEWTHINAITYNAQLDQIALSVLGFNELWIIDHSTTIEEAAGHAGGRSGKGGDLLYRWGNPQAYRAGTATDQRLFAQHDVHWIPPGLPGAGHLLLFNNGRHRPDGEYSSVEEIVPPVDEVGWYTFQPGAAFGPDQAVWSYTAPEKNRFYSLHISGAQRLPNGNTLICSGASGTIFEVTRSGSVVWKCINPVSRHRPGASESRPARRAADNRGTPGDGPGRRSGPKDEPTNTVFRAYRYSPDYPGLAGKNLTPGEKLEDIVARRN